MKLGERIGSIAAEKGISLRKLAINAGVPYNTLYAIVKRKSEKIKSDYLQSIADALDIPVYQLLGQVPERIDLSHEQDGEKDSIKLYLHDMMLLAVSDDIEGLPDGMLKNYFRKHPHTYADVKEVVKDNIKRPVLEVVETMDDENQKSIFLHYFKDDDKK